MVIPSSNLLPFTQYQWPLSENFIEIAIVSGIILAWIGYLLYKSWGYVGTKEVEIEDKEKSISSENTSLEILLEQLKTDPLSDIPRFTRLVLQAINLKTGSKVNPRLPAQSQTLPATAKKLLQNLEELTYAKSTTYKDLDLFRSRLLQYLI
jgi:hypothetical protein